MTSLGEAGPAATEARQASQLRPRTALSCDRRSLLTSGTAGLGGALIGAVGVVADRNVAGAAGNDTLRVASSWNPVGIDPHAAFDPGSSLMTSGIFEGLITIRPGTTRDFVPSLAEFWQANDDYSSWTFSLRPGILFHDGSHCDAAAVRASFERLLALELSPAVVFARFLESADQIAVVDDLTIRFDLGRPQRMFDAALASRFGTGVMNVAVALQHEVDGDWGGLWTQSSAEGLGTGPYRFVSFDAADGIELERFDDYWGGWDGPHFERIVSRVVLEGESRRELIESGEVDIVVNPQRESIAELSENDEIRVELGSNLLIHMIAMNGAGQLATPEARQAMCWAFPYAEAIEGAYVGFAAQPNSAVSRLCRGFVPVAHYSTDLEMARSLLEKAGVGAGARFTAMYEPGNALVETLAQLFQANLAQIGIELELQPIDLGTYFQMMYSDLPAADRADFLPTLRQPDYDDAWSQLWPTMSCETWSTGNIGNYCNDEVDELLKTARDTTDENVYQQAITRVQEIVTVEDPAAIYVAEPNWITVLRADIGGYVLNRLAGEVIDYYAIYRIEPGGDA